MDFDRYVELDFGNSCFCLLFFVFSFKIVCGLVCFLGFWFGVST